MTPETPSNSDAVENKTNLSIQNVLKYNSFRKEDLENILRNDPFTEDKIQKLLDKEVNVADGEEETLSKEERYKLEKFLKEIRRIRKDTRQQVKNLESEYANQLRNEEVNVADGEDDIASRDLEKGKPSDGKDISMAKSPIENKEVKSKEGFFVSDEFVSEQAFIVEEAIKNTLPEEDRQSERNFSIETRGKDKISITSYGITSFISTKDGKIYFEDEAVPYNLNLLTNSGKLLEGLEKNKVSFQEALRFINTIHFIIRRYIGRYRINFSKSTEPFYLKGNAINFKKEGNLLFDTTILKKQFKGINNSELVRFLNNLYQKSNSQKSGIIEVNVNGKPLVSTQKKHI